MTPLSAPGGTENGFVHSVDIFNTIINLAGGTPIATVDSLSFKNSVYFPGSGTPRSVVYSESNSDNGWVWVPPSGGNPGYWQIGTLTRCMPGNQTGTQNSDKLTRAVMRVDSFTGDTFKYIRQRYGSETCPLGAMPSCATTLACTQSTLCSELIVQEQLYDLNTDPNELCNLITDGNFCAQLTQLRADLEALSGP